MIRCKLVLLRFLNLSNYNLNFLCNYIAGSDKYNSIEDRIEHIFLMYKPKKEEKRNEIEINHRPSFQHDPIPNSPLMSMDFEESLKVSLNSQCGRNKRLIDWKKAIISENPRIESISCLRYNNNNMNFHETADNDNDYLALIKTNRGKYYIVPSGNMKKSQLEYCDICYDVDTKSWPAKIHELTVVEYDAEIKSYTVLKKGLISD